MKTRFRRFLTWLLATMLVLLALTGCAGTGGQAGAVTMAGTAAAESAMAEEIASSPAAEGTTAALAAADETVEETTASSVIDEHGAYTSKDEVALYIHIFNRLPDNYITKKEAQNLGWDSKEGNLWDVAPGMSIGGSNFGNYEGLLPDQEGRRYYECDLDYEGGYRGAKRLIYSNDGLIFYTEDHYKTFEQLY